MIILDSGLGGLSVVRALKKVRPDIRVIYCADTAGFPYGGRTPEDLNLRATSILSVLLVLYPQSPVVLACNTLSTLCLAHLRTQFSVPIIGTVPAIKTAGQHSVSRRFTLLATPNTAGSQYTQNLIQEFAHDCVVDVYGAPQLASMAERLLLEEDVDRETLRKELRPAFVNDGYGKTDVVVLGCTHYPLILEALKQAAPWSVSWIDSGEAIARRALTFSAPAPADSFAYITDVGDVTCYQPVFAREGFNKTSVLSLG